jgi:hypothetical protein
LGGIDQRIWLTFLFGNRNGFVQLAKNALKRDFCAIGTGLLQLLKSLPYVLK